MKRGILLVAFLTAAACAPRAGPATRTAEIVFLTRGECPNTPAMRAGLDAALKSLALPPKYQVVSQDDLPSSDVRTGYPTPTILVGGHDLFGMPVPTPPFPDPT